VSFPVDRHPDPDDVAFLEAQLNEATHTQVGGDPPVELAVFVRDDAGEMHAGVYGMTWQGTCELQHLWVSPDRREQGLGSALLEAAEQEAARRGCTQVVLFSHEFQARSFYEVRGYRVVGRVADYPHGDAALWFHKPLGGP
jgi:GNAT superfamily N-acetyltransferase